MAAKTNAALEAKLEADHTATVTAAKAAAAGWPKYSVFVGFSAFYAVYVHEMKGPFQQGEPQFLRNAMEENKAQIAYRIRRYL